MQDQLVLIVTVTVRNLLILKPGCPALLRFQELGRCRLHASSLLLVFLGYDQFSLEYNLSQTELPFTFQEVRDLRSREE